VANRQLTPLHDVDDVPTFVADALNDGLAHWGATLQPWKWEDYYSQLVIDCLSLGQRYDAAKGSITFSTWAGGILRKRVVSRFREDLGDSRYKRDPSKLPPRGEGAIELPDGGFEATARGDFTEEVLSRNAIAR
jgi:hypothetical protein